MLNSRIKQWHWSFQETIPSWDGGTPRKKYPIYDLTLNQYPVSGLLYNWAFVHGLINNDEKVASSKNKPNLRLECKNHTLFKTKMAMIDTLFLTKTAEKPYPSGPHIPI